MITDVEIQKLVLEAKKALKNSYALKNKINYSASVLTKNGSIYSGVSYFSDTYTLTLHGEQAALAHAAFHGEDEIIAIAVASNEEKNKGEFTNPCGLCKQLMYESQKRSSIPMIVILSNNNDEVKQIKLDDMISFPWPA